MNEGCGYRDLRLPEPVSFGIPKRRGFVPESWLMKRLVARETPCRQRLAGGRPQL